MQSCIWSHVLVILRSELRTVYCMNSVAVRFSHQADDLMYFASRVIVEVS